MFSVMTKRFLCYLSYPFRCVFSLGSLIAPNVPSSCSIKEVPLHLYKIYEIFKAFNFKFEYEMSSFSRREKDFSNTPSP